MQGLSLVSLGMNDIIVASATMIGAFLVVAILTDNYDDDDHDGGMMIPAYQGAK